MLGRQVGTSLLRLPRVARLPIRSFPPCRQQQQYDLAIRTFASSAQRFDTSATAQRPGRPKKAVGEPSRPVKRDAKRASKSSKEDAAAKKLKERRKADAEKKKKAAAKEKELKAEQKQKLAKRKARQAERLEKDSLAELKKAALNPPPVGRHSAWTVYVQENSKGSAGGTNKIEALRAETQRLGEGYRNLTPAEREHYNHLSHTAREQALAAHKKYVESFSVQEIEAANLARSRLRRKLKDTPRKANKWTAIKDERRPKLPSSPYIQFNISRQASGDFHGISFGESAKLIGQEWKALGEGEKKKWYDLWRQDYESYKDTNASIHV